MKENAMTTFTSDNQRGVILRCLRFRPRCGTEFLSMFIPRYSARIWELNQEGYEITKKQCKRHSHRSRQYLYELVS